MSIQAATDRVGGRWTLRKWVAATAIGALVAGTLVAVGVGMNQAAAAGPAPDVSVNEPASHIAGEDLDLELVFESAGGSDRYNLSAGVVLPADAVFVDGGTLGSPREYPAGAVLPGAIAAGTQPATCEALGLEAAPAGAPAASCRVPEGKQYLVFQNISDLPDGATTSHTITVRPDASAFPVSSDFPYQANAYTSGDERFIPVFPGSTGVNSSLAQEATSNVGVAADSVPVNALRIEKSEPSPEGELLRGVHQNSTTYTLRVWHTGEGDISDVVVTDLLPAGLEYLGLGGVDNTTNANGNRGGDEASLEYDGSGRLTSTPAPAGSDWSSTDRPAIDPSRNANTGGETVETVEIDGAVYTRVTWNIGELLAAGLADYSVVDPVAQQYADTAGEAGFFEIRYRAAIPLFENTLDFGYDADTAGQQAANLDNNRGPSTRHGIDDAERNAKTYENRAEATGTYGGLEVGDDDTENVDAVDVRVLKTVDSGGASSGTFYQGNNARYTLNIATSEYVSAELGERPDRLVDDLADGLCPVFPPGTAITPGASEHENTPSFVIGDPNPGGDREREGLTSDEWNAALADYGVGTGCGFPSSAADADDALVGATLTGVAFDPVTGHFFLDLALPDDALPAGLSEGHAVSYSAAQNAAYYGSGSNDGATTSGDRVVNTVEIQATTTAIDGVSDLENAGGHDAGTVEAAWDDSSAALEAELSDLSKQVLQREAGVPEPDQIATAPDAAAWVDTAGTPFAIGDEVWYRVTITPPAGTDVRNPRFTDFLPQGVEFDPVLGDDGRPANIWVEPSADRGLGSCEPTNRVEWLDTFVPTDGISVNGNVLTFDLGSNDCVADSDDRFLPVNTALTVYIRGTVVDQSAFGEVDLAQNLAKYQQNNVDGDIFFLRDDAEMTLAQDLNLVKGIRDINGAPNGGNAFGSDVDHQRVVQGDRVTYRLDITAPQVDSTGYTVWDALPVGVTAADIDVDAHTATLIENGAETGALDASGWTAAVHDPGDYPADVEQHLRQSVKDEGRSIIVWTIDAEIPGSTIGDDDAEPAVPAVTRGLSLGYTLVVPDGADGGPAAQLTQEYHNDASIVQYSAVSNGDGNTPLVPEGENTLSTVGAEDVPGAYPVPEDGTYDPSDIYLPNAEMTKTLISTEVGPDSGPTPPAGENDLDPNNPDGAIVQGEYATFEYSATIPGNTTVHDAKLSDRGSFTWTGNPSNPADREIRYHFLDDSAEASYPAGIDTSGFTLHQQGSGENPGTLVFPAEYTNGTDEAQVFSVRVTVWIDDRDASNPQRNPDFPNNKELTNTAEFEFTSPADENSTVTLEDSADVQYREPNLDITKTADPQEEVQARQEVAYTLTVTNANRVKAYDNTVVDTVPAGLVVDTGQAALAGATFLDDDGDDTEASLNAGTGGMIRWDHTAFPQLSEVPAPAVLTYTAVIEDTTGGGQQYLNTAEVTGFTLPGTVGGESTAERRGDRAADDSATVTAETADIVKGVRVLDSGDFEESASAPIGETVEYEVQVHLQPNINYYNARIVDAFSGAGIGTPERVSIAGPTAAPEGSVEGEWSESDGTWTIVNPQGDPHIVAATEQRTLTITYRVALENDMTADQLANQVELQWTTRAGGDIDDPDDRRTVDDDAVVTVLNPELNIVKRVDGEDSIERDPNAAFPYTIEVRNTGDTAAHHVTVQDVVPAGIVIEPGSITPSASSVDPGVYSGEGGTIVWDRVPGPLGTGADDVLAFGYTAGFAESAELSSDDFPYVNVANVTHFESFEEGGRTYEPPLEGAGAIRDTADVTPLFPLVVPEKSVTAPVPGEEYGIAYLDTPFNWTLTITNSGEGVAGAVDVVDTLPENWEYVGNATVNGVALAEGPALSSDGRTLTWSAADLTAAVGDLFPLAAGDAFVITFDAQPTADAIDAPGTGLEVGVNPHTNSVDVERVTDAQGNEENGDGHYRGDRSTADAYIAEADLELAKEAAGGTAADLELSNGETLPAGSWVAGASAGQQIGGAEYTQPQWRITVTNHGPDQADGPFVFDDTTTVPAGASTGPWSAVYYPSAADAVAGTNGVPLTLTPTDGGFEVTGAVDGRPLSLQADGGDRIVVSADVTILDEATASGEQLHNVASVEGQTFERDANKPEGADHPNEDDAAKPLTLVADLTVEKVLNTTDPTVGGPITWGIAVTNLGPSASLSPADNPITVTDTVPAGVTGVTASSNADWAATLADGSAIPADGVGEGATILWTYTGDGMPVGATAEVTLSGTILSSHTGALVNEAQVTPGDTPEPPGDEPNEDEETTTPSDDTALSIAKTRVVEVNGEWVIAAEQDPVPPFVAGDPVSYLIEVGNVGTADARALTVVDESPAGLAYSAHAGLDGTQWDRTAGGTNAAGASDAGWDTFALTTPATLPAGESRSFVVTYTTEPTITGDVVNWAEASAENSTNDPRDPDDSGSTRSADLSIEKTHTSPAPGENAVAGGSVDYQLVVTNNGPSVASAPIDVLDTLPAGFSYRDGTALVSVNGGGATAAAPAVSGQELLWEDLTGGVDLPLHATATITFTADIAAGVRAQTGVLNAADVSGPEDANPDNNRDEDPVDIVTSTDMAIVKSVEAGPWVAGTDVSYTLTIRNDGPSEAPASVTDTLPAGLTMVSMSGADWDCSTVTAGAQDGTCEFTGNGGLHPVGEANATTVTVTASIDPNGAELPQPLNNIAVLSWTDSEGTHTDDDDEAITVTRVADLGIEKLALDEDGDETASAVAGTSLWYSLDVRNEGPSDAVAPLIVNDTLPAGVSFEGLAGASAEAWSAEVDPSNPQSVTFTRTPAAGLPLGQAAPRILFEVSVDPAVAAGAQLENVAAIDEATLTENGDPVNDPGEAPDTDSAVVTVERQVDLGVVKSHDAGQVRVGDELPFSIDVTNHGPSQATGIAVTDTIPAGLEVVSGIGPVLDAAGDETGWTIESITLADADDPAGGATVVASYAEALAPGEQAAPLTITTLVTPSAYDTVTNVADVSGNEPEPDPDDEHPNRDEDQVVVPPLVTLEVEKTAVSEFQVGKQGTFEITVTNHGPTADPGPITVTDALPEGLRFASSPDAGVQVAGQTVAWVLEEGLGVDESVTLTLVVHVGQGAYPSVTNSVTVDSAAEKTPESQLTDSETVEVRAADALAITGGDTAALVLLALLLMLLGGAAYALRRRRVAAE